MSMAPVFANSEDVKTFVLEQGHGVKGLSELHLKTIPNQFIQPLEERDDTSHVLMEESIPIIDMSEWDNPKVTESICNAAEKFGFFQIVNHGVPDQVIEDLKNATHRFFGLPAEEKRKYLRGVSPSSSVRYGTSFSPKAEKALEWKDHLSCLYVSDDIANALWPSVCRNELLEYTKGCESFLERLFEVLMKKLNVPMVDKATQSILMGAKRINLNYYPICPNPELTVGVSGHSDPSTLTILLQDEIGGLYVRKLQETDSWIHVPPIKGALIINIGDALEIMSNGLYKSAEHRVVANGSSNRISVPLFVSPRNTDVVGPLPEVLEGGEKAIYKHVLYSEYMNHFFGKGHDGKETINFVRIS